MPKQKTIPELKAEIADNERQLRRSRYLLPPITGNSSAFLS